MNTGRLGNSAAFSVAIVSLEFTTTVGGVQP